MLHSGKLALIRKHHTRLERLARDKHSSLLRKGVTYGRKKFYNIGSCLPVVELDTVDDVTAGLAANDHVPTRVYGNIFLSLPRLGFEPKIFFFFFSFILGYFTAKSIEKVLFKEL